jgi:hypothetical protein
VPDDRIASTLRQLQRSGRRRVRHVTTGGYADATVEIIKAC